jgi:hypothetical protein
LRCFRFSWAEVRATYSIVVPILNEAETLPELAPRLIAFFERLDGRCEAILRTTRERTEASTSGRS